MNDKKKGLVNRILLGLTPIPHPKNDEMKK